MSSDSAQADFKTRQRKRLKRKSSTSLSCHFLDTFLFLPRKKCVIVDISLLLFLCSCFVVVIVVAVCCSGVADSASLTAVRFWSLLLLWGLAHDTHTRAPGGLYLLYHTQRLQVIHTDFVRDYSNNSRYGHEKSKKRTMR